MEEKIEDYQIEVSDDDFEKNVIEQSKKIPIVVDFWAEWCIPCLAFGPVLEKLAKEYNGRFILAKLNVNENVETAQRYSIMSIPNVKLFKNGKIVDGFVGALPEQAVREWLDKNITNDKRDL
ncbi:MAG: thioredoxin [Candidatus Aenigmatarchaeota archaeon]